MAPEARQKRELAGISLYFASGKSPFQSHGTAKLNKPQITPIAQIKAVRIGKVTGIGAAVPVVLTQIPTLRWSLLKSMQ